MTASVIVFQDPRRKAWTDEDLAEIRRVGESLEAAGIPIDCEFGFTDEGDPWCVICNAVTGKVLIHFARIGPRYISAVVCLGFRLEGGRLPKLECGNWAGLVSDAPSHQPPNISGDT